MPERAGSQLSAFRYLCVLRVKHDVVHDGEHAEAYRQFEKEYLFWLNPATMILPKFCCCYYCDVRVLLFCLGLLRLLRSAKLFIATFCLYIRTMIGMSSCPALDNKS